MTTRVAAPLTAVPPRQAVVHVRADLDGWADQWDALALADPLPTPFLQSWWLGGAASAPGCYVLVVDGETLLGGLALDRHRRLGVDLLTLRSQGKLCPDHLDLVARPDAVADVVAALRGWLTSPGNRVLDLGGLREDAHLLGVFPGTTPTVLDVTVHEPLHGNLDRFYAARSKSFRKQSRKFARGLDRRDIVCRRVSDAEVPAAVADFWALHEARAERQELYRHRAQLDRAIEGALAAGDLWVHVAELNGVRGVVVVAFTTGNRLSLYQMARTMDPVFNHAGTVVDLQVLTETCLAGFTEFDLLRGAEPYKFAFAAHQRQLLALQWSHGARGRLVLAARQGAAWARKAAALLRGTVARTPHTVRRRRGPANEAT